MNCEDKYLLITKNIKEIIGSENEIKDIIKTRSLKIYWGTAPTGRIHIGYFVPILKIADYLRADCKVTILIADLHAFLDSNKSNLNVLEARTKYYKKMIKKILLLLNVNIEKLLFVKGTDFQLSKQYTMDMYKFHSLVSLNQAQHAGSEVVKQTNNPILTNLLYPGLQALDEEYLDIDLQFGGVDQRKIFMYARSILPQLGYKKRFYLMNEMIPGLKSDKAVGKMSASDNKSKIDLLDSKNQIKKKINKAYCIECDIDNSLIIILEKIIFPVLSYYLIFQFIINRKEKFGGSIIYNNIDEVKNDFKKGVLHPADLKLGIIDSLNQIIIPIRNYFINNTLVLQAYPN